MTDVVLTGVTVAYGVIAVLAGTLLVLSLKARRQGEPRGRSLTLALGMLFLLLQGLLIAVVIGVGGIPEESFLLYSSLLEAAGLACFLGATVS
jgi:hypothetical protein